MRFWPSGAPFSSMISALASSSFNGTLERVSVMILAWPGASAGSTFRRIWEFSEPRIISTTLSSFMNRISTISPVLLESMATMRSLSLSSPDLSAGPPTTIPLIFVEPSSSPPSRAPMPVSSGLMEILKRSTWRAPM